MPIADNMNIETGILRTHGMLLFSIGNFTEGRKQFQKALDIFEKYKINNEFIKLSVNLQTEIAWATLEINYMFKDNAISHFEKAKKLLLLYPPQNIEKDLFEENITYLEEQIYHDIHKDMNKTSIIFGNIDKTNPNHN